MAKKERIRKKATLAALLFLNGAVEAATGRVVDPEGNPVAGARVCYVVGGAGDAYCDQTSADGRYTLPGGSLPSLKISAKGFFARSVPALDLPGPVVLSRAATIHALLVDAGTGEPVGQGDVSVLYPWGEERGPFPGNAAGVEIGSLPPGEVTVVARSPGYVEFRAGPVAVAAGPVHKLVLRLIALASPPAPAEERP